MMDRAKAREKALALVSQMSVEERASQLRYDSPAIERLGIPAYNWWNEALHGVARAGTATSFPQAIAMAASFDPALLTRVADTVATEARAKYNAASRHGDRDIYKGLTFWSPNINIFRAPRWGRGHETYGEDPYLTAELGKAYVRGLQGEGETMKVAACAKHFAVHSGPEAIRHHFDARATKKDMGETYLPAFEALVKDAHVEAVMGAYNRTNGEACCASRTLLKETLRESWGFEGHIVSDCWAIRDLFEGHGISDTPEEAAALALAMGCDLNCGNTYHYLMSAYRKGLVTEEQITEAAVRLFTTRYLLGIMGEGSEYDAIPYSVVSCAEHKALAEEVSRRACVLLKNDGLLPLNAEEYKTIGVIGPNAASRRALIGNYYGTPDRYVTVLEGIQNEVGSKCRVLYSLGCALKKDRDEPLAMAGDRLAEALTVAEQSDVVVLVVGLDETLEGEEPDEGNVEGSGDKKDLLLPESQRKLMDAVLALGKKTVIVLMAGSAIDLAGADDRANALLDAWYPGALGGKAVAELLFGAVSPSGKLPVSFYRNEALAAMPAFTDYAMRERTYRYYTGTPLYPFGYGLTYGDTRVTAFSADKNEAHITVRNDGSYGTEDVVQVYCRDEHSPFAPTNPVLCAFQRVFLAAGEEKTLTLSLGPKTFTVVNEEGERVEGSGEWTLYAAFSQCDARSEELTGKKALTYTVKA